MPPDPPAPRETPSLVAELTARTRDLFVLLRSAPELGPEAAVALEKTSEDLDRRLVRTRVTIALAGDSSARRALLDVLLGERVFAGVQRDPITVTRVRAGADLSYEARLRGGGVERFDTSVPPRDDAFAKAIVRADNELASAEDDARRQSIGLEKMRRQAKTILIEPPSRAAPFVALWRWLIGWLYGLFARAARPAPLVTEGDVAAPLRDAEARLAKATAHRAALTTDREQYTVERRASFFAALRTLADAFARGGEVLELTIELPSPALPDGITVMNAPELASSDGVDGGLFVTDGSSGSRERSAPILSALDSVAPLSIAPTASPREVRDTLEAIRRAAPLMAIERAASLARSCIATATAERARAEAVCHERIDALMKQRLADPSEFRARAMDRMEKAIGEATRDVVRLATERLPPRIDALKNDCRERVLASADRKAIESSIQSIRDDAPARMGALVEESNDFVLREMQRASDTMQTWVVEEIHARYQVARRASIGDGPAPVITEDTSGEFTASEEASLREALDTFEKGRVSYGLAGSALGTLVAPIGTAIGTFLGAFADLFKGIDSLKQECAAKIDECIDESARQVRAQLEARYASLTSALRASLEEALDTSMQRFERSIARLMDLETRTWEAERAKLARLDDLRAALETHEARLTTFSEKAREELRASLPPQPRTTARTRPEA